MVQIYFTKILIVIYNLSRLNRMLIRKEKRQKKIDANVPIVKTAISTKGKML